MLSVFQEKRCFVADKQTSKLRYMIVPLLLGAVYLVQQKIPGLFEAGALWSEHPRWWQFFTNGFLSGNSIHLLINAVGIWFVFSQFASKIRTSFLLIYFTIFSAAASYLYFLWAMPSHATLVGSSGGVYSLLGFSSWFFRRERIGFFGKRSLSAPVLLFMVFLLIMEFFVARYWVPVLAWQLHLIAFGVSLFVALMVHAVYLLTHWLAECEQLMFRKLFRSGRVVLRWIRRIAVLTERDPQQP